MKKLLAVLLSLCLVVGMLPMMAFAADETVEDVKPTDEAVLIRPGKSDPSADEETGAQRKVKYYDGSTTQELEIGTVMPATGTPLAKARNNTTNVYYKYVSDALNHANSGDTVEVLVTTAIQSNTVKAGVTLTVEEGVELSVAESYVLTVYGTLDCTVTGTVVYENDSAPGNDPTTDPGEKDDDDGVEEVPPTTGDEDKDDSDDHNSDDYIEVLYPVTFYVPSRVVVTVKDSNGDELEALSDNVWSLPNGSYTYTLSYRGEVFNTGGFTVDGSALNIGKDWVEPSWRVTVKPSAHGDVWVNNRNASYGDYVKIYVDPDSGYYLSDLTVTTVGGKDVKVWHLKDNVYEFRMPGSRVVVDADFAAAPSEYRVYIDSGIKHGSVSADTVYAEEGDWVYITAKPDVGYRLYTLTVTRPSGNTVKVEHVRDNVYRFKMPGVRVTVDAEFIRTVTPFTDVHLSDWFYEYVSFAYRYGLMEGINSYQFAPDATATRAMVVQILYRMSGEPSVSYTSGFADVAPNAWYADAIAWAARNNIVNGTGATTFSPNAPVTREQFATMLYRYAQYRNFNTSLTSNILSYYDVNQVSEYAFGPLQWACAEGIINGTSTGYLSPQGNATRAQLAAMLMRFCTEYFDL